jgi:hypothetical protein
MIPWWQRPLLLLERLVFGGLAVMLLAPVFIAEWLYFLIFDDRTIGPEE